MANASQASSFLQERSIEAEALTGAQPFENIPIIGKELLSVNAGTPLSYAITHASCIIDSLREMACDGSASGGISERAAWLMEANLATVYALLSSIERAGQLVSGRAA